MSNNSIKCLSFREMFYCFFDSDALDWRVVVGSCQDSTLDSMDWIHVKEKFEVGSVNIFGSPPAQVY